MPSKTDRASLSARRRRAAGRARRHAARWPDASPRSSRSWAATRERCRLFHNPFYAGAHQRLPCAGEEAVTRDRRRVSDGWGGIDSSAK